MPSKKKNAKPEVPSSTPTLTTEQITAAAINKPALAKDEITLGDRTFKILDLEYDQYLEFTGYLSPMFQSLAKLVTQRAGVSVPGIEIPAGSVNADFLMQFCGKSLPNMALLVVNMQAVVEKKPEDKVTVEWLKKQAKTPFVLSKIVMKQVEKNNMIAEFLDFFVQALPTLMTLQRIAAPATATTPTA